MDNTSLNITQEFQNVYFPPEIIINLLLAFILGVVISIVYKKTHKGLSYSQSFMITNIFICVIVAIVIMIIGNNLARAFALVGALSIIRFRTVIKDTKDIAFIFWSLAAGMGAGTGSYFISIVGTIFLVIIAIVLFKTNFGSIYKSEFILQFRYLRSDGEQTEYLNLIKKYARSHTLLNAEPSGDEKTIKLTFDILMKEDEDLNKFIDDISKLENVSEVSLTASKNDIDY
tara:strand:+ start:112 stop:801 length:690 start_codon:yes stop_codon:yes gene_type:complete